MLESANPRMQRPPRRPAVNENPVIEAKPDTMRRVQRPIAPRKQQHRRHYSVPDNLLMNIASTSPESDNFKMYQPSLLRNSADDVMNGDGGRHRQAADASIGNSFYIQPLLSPSEAAQGQNKSAAQNHFPDFLPSHPDDAAKMIDDLFSFDTYAHGPMMRRGSAPQNSVFGSDALKNNGMQRAQTFPRNNSSLATPPQGASMQCLSTFDLAPLPHNSFINLATLSIPLNNNDVESYFPPGSAMASPTFPAMQSPTESRHAGMFENTMSTVIEESFESGMIKVPPLPENSTFDITDVPSKRRERGETTPQPIGAKTTGISMEEISSFISGPSPSDGKWVCKYPECDKRFGRKENIKSHVQTHLGDRQFQCAVCKKCFVRQHDLKRHSKIHTGIKPYPCLCGNSFARHDALTRHRQRGMCIGAFEGIVKKVAKRGRPRKKPANEDGSEETKKERNSDGGSEQEQENSSSSFSGSDVSDPRSPAALDCASPSPDTPNFDQDQYDSSESSAGRSVKEESPELHRPCSPDDYTPPTSPPELYDFEHFAPKLEGSKRNSCASSSLPDEDFKPQGFKPRDFDYSELGLPNPGNDSGKYGSTSEYSSDDFSQASAHGDDFMFSHEGLAMFGLSTLERDPGILELAGEDIYIKPELLSNP